MKHTTFLMIATIVLLLSANLAADESPPVEKMQRALNEAGVTISGSIEIEAGYTDTDTDDTSDIRLATVELGVEAKPIQHLSGHLVLLFEEDDTELEIDQGYIRLDGEDRCPFYAEAGRLYLPFGNNDSHFISDPLTQEIGETRESALVLGYGNDTFDITVGVFNGDVNETNQSDDTIDGWSVGAVFSRPVSTGISFTAGAAYLSNIGDSDGLTDQLATPDTVQAHVPAMATFVFINWKEALFFKAAHVMAMDNFAAAELVFDNGQEVKPWALNVEMAYAISPRLEVGLRYGASNDGGDFLPETLYGAVAGFTIRDHMGVALEFQTGEYEYGGDITTATLQWTLEF